MYDRVGGHVMRWSSLTGQQWSGSTLPLNHDGAFNSIELTVWVQTQGIDLLIDINMNHSLHLLLASCTSLPIGAVNFLNTLLRNAIKLIKFQTLSNFRNRNATSWLWLALLFLTQYPSPQVDQSVFTVCPSVPDIRPSMVFIFEVFLLRGPMVPTDRVVAWGAFPLCDKECRLEKYRNIWNILI